MTSRNSATDPGHRGSAAAAGRRARASAHAGSGCPVDGGDELRPLVETGLVLAPVVRGGQWSASPSGTRWARPGPSSSGRSAAQRVRARRSARSSRSASGISMRNGRMSSVLMGGTVRTTEDSSCPRYVGTLPACGTRPPGCSACCRSCTRWRPRAGPTGGRRAHHGDIDRLRGLGYPVHSAPGVTGGYRLAPELQSCRRCSWTTTRLWRWRSGCAPPPAGRWRASRSRRSGPWPSSSGAARPAARRLAALSAATVPLTGPRPTVDADDLSTIATACRDHQVLRFDYRRNDGSTARRTVEPPRPYRTAVVPGRVGRRRRGQHLPSTAAAVPSPSGGSRPPAARR